MIVVQDAAQSSTVRETDGEVVDLCTILPRGKASNKEKFELPRGTGRQCTFDLPLVAHLDSEAQANGTAPLQQQAHCRRVDIHLSF